MSVSCNFAVNGWERADLLKILYVIFSCVFVTFPFRVLSQVRYLFVSIPYLYLHLVFPKWQQKSSAPSSADTPLKSFDKHCRPRSVFFCLMLMNTYNSRQLQCISDAYLNTFKG